MYFEGKIKITECPRDAMQGLHSFVKTDEKIEYLNQLLKVGFDVLDCGSFVSSKAIPQMADTDEVLRSIDKSSTYTEILVIVANMRGAETACRHHVVDTLGFPFSISEEFQKRNTNSTIKQSVQTLSDIKKLCDDNNKNLVAYLSMGFGNPYKEPWSVGLVQEWVGQLVQFGIKTISLSDTVGVAKPNDIGFLFENLTRNFNQTEFGAHFHTTNDNWLPILESAFNAGCRRFDGAIRGFGGCPMANDKLTGNLATENLVYFLSEKGVKLQIDLDAFKQSIGAADSLFSRYQ